MVIVCNIIWLRLGVDQRTESRHATWGEAIRTIRLICCLQGMNDHKSLQSFLRHLMSSTFFLVIYSIGLRPPLKIILFPVHRPGELMSAEWIHFFHISEIIFSSIFHIISIQRKKYIEKKKFCGLPTGHNYGHPVDRKQTFFKGGLKGIEYTCGVYTLVKY